MGIGLTIGVMAPVAMVSPVNAVAMSSSSVQAIAGSSAVSAPKTRVAKKPGYRNTHARYGIKGSPSVRNVQKLLISKRYASSSLRRAGATGNYLSATRSSVARFQRKLGYRGPAADGIIGKTSAQKLGMRWVVTKRKTKAKPASKPVASAPSASGRQLTPLSAVALKRVIMQAGFTGTNACKAWGIAMRESGGIPGIRGSRNTDGTYDHGLFQINDVHKANINFASIYNPLFNAKYAYSITNRGTDYSHWGLGSTGWAGTLKKKYPQTWKQLKDLADKYERQCPR